MIPRLKRQTKKRHSVRAEGVRLRWKRGGQWVEWRSPKWRHGSVTVTLSPERLDLIGATVTPDAIGSTVHIHYKALA